MSEYSEILYFDELVSTNLYAKEHYRELADNTLIIAGSQTGGRGRLGRKWLSPANCNIYATLLIKNVHDPNLVGAIVGLSALAVIREVAPELKAYIKWPNDIYVGKAKLAGILSESCELKDGKLSVVGCGVGINVNSTREELNLINQAATSLFCETKTEFNLNFFRKRLAFFANWYYIMYLNSYTDFFAEWVKFNKLIGQELTLIDAQGILHSGIACRINYDGGLVLREKLCAVSLNKGIAKGGMKAQKTGDSDASNRNNSRDDSIDKSNGGVDLSQEFSEEERVYYCGDVSVDKSSIDFDKLF